MSPRCKKEDRYPATCATTCSKLRHLFTGSSAEAQIERTKAHRTVQERRWLWKQACHSNYNAPLLHKSTQLPRLPACQECNLKHLCPAWQMYRSVPSHSSPTKQFNLSSQGTNAQLTLQIDQDSAFRAGSQMWANQAKYWHVSSELKNLVDGASSLG